MAAVDTSIYTQSSITNKMWKTTDEIPETPFKGSSCVSLGLISMKLDIDVHNKVIRPGILVNLHPVYVRKGDLAAETKKKLAPSPVPNTE
eukprot:1823508-Ditylum_brightwellii.AAC.1